MIAIRHVSLNSYIKMTISFFSRGKSYVVWMDKNHIWLIGFFPLHLRQLIYFFLQQSALKLETDQTRLFICGDSNFDENLTTNTLILISKQNKNENEICQQPIPQYHIMELIYFHPCPITTHTTYICVVFFLWNWLNV